MSNSISCTVAFLMIPNISSSSRWSKSLRDRFPIHCIQPCMLLARVEQHSPMPQTMSSLSFALRSSIRLILLLASSTQLLGSSEHSMFSVPFYFLTVAQQKLHCSDLLRKLPIE